MKTRTIVSLILTLAVMVLVPVITIYTALSGDALGLMFLYTMVLNPVVSVVIGILSGWDKKVQWYLPVVNALVYLIAAIVMMESDVFWFVGAVVYLVLGIAAAYVTNAIRKRKAAK